MRSEEQITIIQTRRQEVNFATIIIIVTCTYLGSMGSQTKAVKSISTEHVA